MAAADEREAIVTHFIDNWVDNGIPRTQVAVANDEFTPPDDEYWVRIGISAGEGFQLEMGGGPGGNTHRYPGTVYVQVFAPLNRGDYDARVLADHAADIFRATSIDGGTNENIFFRTPTIRNIGIDDGWYQVNCIVPFIRNTLH